MKHSILALILIAIIHVFAYGQSRPTAGRLMGGSTVPTGSCNSSITRTDIYIRSGVPAASSIYLCNAGAWVLFAGGGSPGGSDTQLQRNNSSVFGGISGATSDGTNVTFGSTNLRAARPRFSTSIDDSNGNEVFGVTATGSAVNEFTVANAAAGGSPVLSATGSDTDIGITLTPKGAGTVNIAGTGTSSIGIGDTDNSHYLKILAGSNLTADRNLSFVTGDAARTITLAGDFTTSGANALTLTTAGATNVTLPTTGTIVARDSTDTFTNKTYSTEGTGNVFSQVAPIYLTAAGCSNATAGTMWDLPVTTPAVAVCVTGTNVQKGALEFADSGPFIAQNTFALPADWTSTGGIDASIYWTTTATSGDIKWNISTACAAVGGTAADDPAFNAAQVVTTTTAGTTNFVNTSTQAALTLTGCTTATPMMFHVKVMRDGTTSGDTIAATARLIGVEIRYRRAQ